MSAEADAARAALATFGANIVRLMDDYVALKGVAAARDAAVAERDAAIAERDAAHAELVDITNQLTTLEQHRAQVTGE